MKWLLVLLVVLGGIWWLRQTGRGIRRPPASRQQQAARTTESETRPMTQCRQCGLHLPLEDALQGQQGHYCSAAHRQQHEG